MMYNIKMSYKEHICGTGFVERMEVFGDDLTIVNAARVSFAKESRALTGQDEKLIHYLAKNNHISPFFHPQIRFRIKMPIFVAREWFRHTVGFSRNEVSRRYVDSQPEVWTPAPHHIRARDPRLKQGSRSCAVVFSERAHKIMRDVQRTALNGYNELLELNVAPEIARAVLPQSMYTEFIETASLAAYARLCKLRLDPHAQKEIQIYADVIDRSLRKCFPVAWAALMGEEDVPAPAPVSLAVPKAAPQAAPVILIPTAPLTFSFSLTADAPEPKKNELGLDNIAEYTQWGC
jgi:thymidylate synthase (FAD)